MAENIEKPNLTKEEYINAQRIIEQMVFGPIEGIYNTQDLIAEYKLIKEKKSDLSYKNRNRVESTVELALEKFTEDSKNQDTHRWDLMQSLIEKTRAMTEYLRNITDGSTGLN